MLTELARIYVEENAKLFQVTNRLSGLDREVKENTRNNNCVDNNNYYLKTRLVVCTLHTAA